MMNGSAVPWPLTARSPRPSTNVTAQTTRPGSIRSARTRRANSTTWATRAATTNGQIVFTSPGRSLKMPSACESRPITQNTITSTRSTRITTLPTLRRSERLEV